MSRWLSVAVLLISVWFCGLSESAPITDLPGYSGPPLSMDSGYITVDDSTGKSLFYWLVESQDSPSTDPLVLWLQGGPGCSGLIGLLRENGPFVPDLNGGVTYSALSWTRVANMLYIEAPCGVGFSYSNTTSDYNTNDNITANDNYVFIQKFLKAFPQYQNVDFWITGESYGGVYVPTLTELILSDSSSSLFKQFKGFMVGNPVFGCSSLNYNDVEVKLLYWHSLVSYSDYASWLANNCTNDPNSKPCKVLFVDIYNSVGVIEQPLLLQLKMQKFSQALRQVGKDDNQPSLDPDNIFYDFCTGNGTLDFAVQTSDDCKETLGYLTSKYLNRPDVQKAIHVVRPPPANNTWAPCSSIVNYSFKDFKSMIPLYQKFFVQKPGLSILVYSGDQDVLTCPFAETDVCLAELQRKVVSKWQPWFVNRATVGYVEQFDTYTYATIKGAGHEAPQFQPLIAFNMFQRFLAKQNLNDTSASGVFGRSELSLRQGDIWRMYKNRL